MKVNEMNLDIDEKEFKILRDLVESQSRELHPMIRRSRVSSATDELKHDLEDVERLLEKLKAAFEAESGSSS